MRNRIVALIIFIIIELGVAMGASAQAPALDLIYTSPTISQLMWSSDNQRLVFFDGSPVTTQSVDDSNWFQYILTTKQLTQSKTWPLVPQLNTAENQLFTPTRLDNIQSFVYSSPDNQYLVYPGLPTVDNPAGTIVLGDRVHQQTASTSIQASLPILDPTQFNVLWSQDSSAFVINQRPDQAPVEFSLAGYVSGYRTSLQQLQLSQVKVSINGIDYLSIEAFDISDDGNWVVFSAYRDVPGVSSFSLLNIDFVLWNKSDTTKNQVLSGLDGKKIMALSFSPSNSSKLILVDDSGLLEYSIATQQKRIINGSINSNWASRAVFSPRGDWLAVVHYANNIDTLYLTATQSVNPVTSTPLPSSTLKLQYYPDPTARGNATDGLMPDFNIVNTGSAAVPLSELKIRYYFTRDTTNNAITFRYLCSYVVLPGGCGGSSVVRGTVVKMTTPVTGADSYIELSFTGGTLAANGQTDEILSYVNKSDFSNYTQSNDYSFDGTRNTETFSDWNKVTLYRNGVLVWGVEPQ